MKPLRPFLAALMLFAWLFASAHMAIEHGGDVAVCDDVAAVHNGPGNQDSDPADAHHHHDLGAVRAGEPITAVHAEFIAPLDGQLFAQIAALLRAASTPQVATSVPESPPDQRASGWLHFAHTALPVRGPSFTA